MKTIQIFILSFFIAAVSVAQDAKKDPAQFKRISAKYELFELNESAGDFNFVVNGDDENKTAVKGKLKDYSYLNYDSKTFASADAIFSYYNNLVLKAGGALLKKSDNIYCTSETGYDSGVGSGAIFKMKNNEKDLYVMVILRNEGNYKVVTIE